MTQGSLHQTSQDSILESGHLGHNERGGDGMNGLNGTNGVNGLNGTNGVNGTDGFTALANDPTKPIVGTEKTTMTMKHGMWALPSNGWRRRFRT